ncbi:tyrosine-type recombinase/integrase [Nocardia sp. CA-136227]|uniref:tyrosine-type recombinase/integrase n=1 Tax=Nocardia sp. CA-136227 TaxID=3239979 RepID=UPI003D97210E
MKPGPSNGWPRRHRRRVARLRDATHWDDVVARLGFEHLRRHDLRHTGLTWFADAGVPLHRLQRIAGHTDPRITQRYLHPNIRALQGDSCWHATWRTGVPRYPSYWPSWDRTIRVRNRVAPNLRVIE